MSDFIREVDEDYRRDRIMQFFRRFQVPLALLVIGIVVGAGVWRWWMDSKLAAAQTENERFEQAMVLANSGKDAEAQAAFGAIAANGPPGYALIARMRAAETLAAKDPEAAAKAFDTIANDEMLPASMRDTARFRGALLRVDREDPKAFEERYGRFTSPSFAFHDSIRELLALMELKRNDAASAERNLDEIVADPSAPTALRNRAEAFRLLVTGGPATPMTTQPGPAKVTPVGAPPAPTATTESPAAVAHPAPAVPALPPAAARPPAPAPGRF